MSQKRDKPIGVEVLRRTPSKRQRARSQTNQINMHYLVNERNLEFAGSLHARISSTGSYLSTWRYPTKIGWGYLIWIASLWPVLRRVLRFFLWRPPPAENGNRNPLHAWPACRKSPSTRSQPSENNILKAWNFHSRLEKIKQMDEVFSEGNE